MGKQEWKPHLIERRGGWVISKTNLSTGWCSLSRITTTTFSTSFCRNQDRKSPSLIRAVCCPVCFTYFDAVGVQSVVGAHSTSPHPKPEFRLFFAIRKNSFAKPFLAECSAASLGLRLREMKCAELYVPLDPVLEQRRKCTAISLHHSGMDTDEVKIHSDHCPNRAALYNHNVKLT